MAIRLSDVLEEETIGTPIDLTRRLSDVLDKPIRLSDVLRETLPFEEGITREEKAPTGFTKSMPSRAVAGILRGGIRMIGKDPIKLAINTVSKYNNENEQSKLPIGKDEMDYRAAVYLLRDYYSTPEGKKNIIGWLGEQVLPLKVYSAIIKPLGVVGKIPGIKKLPEFVKGRLTEAVGGAVIGGIEPAETGKERIRHIAESTVGFPVMGTIFAGLGAVGKGLASRFRKLTPAQQTELDTNLKIIFEKEPKKVTSETVGTELAKAETKVTPELPKAVTP